MEYTKPKVCAVINNFIDKISFISSWLCIALIISIIVQVIMRYVFGQGSVLLEELQWHLFGMSIMLALSEAMTKDRNIRLDLLRDRFSSREKLYIEILGIVVLVIPMLCVIFWHSLGFVNESWRLSERSNSPMGLPYRWIIKSIIPVSMSLLFMASASRLVESVSTLKWMEDKNQETK